MSTGLQVKNLAAGYEGITVINDVNLEINPGELVACLGLNGAGKTTTLSAIAGVIGSSSGEVLLDGKPLTGPAHRRCSRGLGLVLEGRSTFASLTVEENLEIGGVEPAEAIKLFPELEKRMRVKCGLVSGGEQQMVSLARAVLRRPQMLLIDELSFGLAPIICTRMYQTLGRLAAESGIGIMFVEQHLKIAVGVASRAYVVHGGRIRLAVDGNLTEREEEIEAVLLGAR
jgi:branched-chain amino acid transport system ATP-binding protein